MPCYRFAVYSTNCTPRGIGLSPWGFRRVWDLIGLHCDMARLFAPLTFLGSIVSKPDIAIDGDGDTLDYRASVGAITWCST
jgi:hypothetical protein